MRFRGLILGCLVLAAGVAGAQTVALPLAANVAALPTCGTTRNGQVYGVRDALTPAIGDVVVGGGAERVVVQCDTSKTGIKWIVVATDEPAAGGGASSFDELASGTNTTAAMVVGTGASLAATGSGTIAATSAATATTASDLTCTNCVGGTEIDETALVVGGDGSGSVAALVVTDDSHAHTGSTLSGIAAADIDTDAIGTDELDDDANTPLAGDFVVVETGAASFDYVAAAAGTDITADLEEETHATEHSLGGTDPVTVTNLASGCTDAQVTGGTAAGTGVECQADDDVPESGDFAAGVDLEADGSLSANSVALTTDTTGNYAAGDGEAGAALTGDSATAFFSSGAVEDARIDTAIHRDAETKDGDLVSFDDGDANFAATDVDSALSELDDDNVSGPNAADGKVEWSQLVGVPAGFADETDDGGAGGMPAREFYWTASSLLPAAPADNIPPIALAQGTNFDLLYVGFDASADECRSGTLKVPADLDTAGTLTFRVVWDSVDQTTGAVMWDFRHIPRTEGEGWDNALTTESAASDSTQGTAGLITITTWTETVSNAGWVAGDEVYFLVCRDGDGTAGTDSMSGDARMHSLTVSVPQA